MMTVTSAVPDHSLLAVGQLFFDLVYANLPEPPIGGGEIWTPAFGATPGGIANFAIVGARFGVPTTLAAAIGDDPISDLCRRLLDGEGIDSSYVVTVDGWSLPVTSSLGFDGDRALVTGGTPSPLSADDLFAGSPPAAAVAVSHLEPGGSRWIEQVSAAGTRVFGDVGWDQSGTWDAADLRQLDECYAFLPNELEAMLYTRTDSAVAAARSLADRVQLSVVTRGARGVVAIDSATGLEIEAAPVRVTAVDPTGAGDVFGAALAIATTTGWSLRESVDFAILVAAITVSRPGGASAVPRPGELVAWLDTHPEAHDGSRFGFVRDAFGPTSASPFSIAHAAPTPAAPTPAAPTPAAPHPEGDTA